MEAQTAPSGIGYTAADLRLEESSIYTENSPLTNFFMNRNPSHLLQTT